jgi:5-formyltetrahydrofolate cyclo-ligase
MNKNINKIEIRKEIKLKLSQLDARAKARKSKLICENIFSYITELKGNRIGLYFPIQNEVNIEPIFELLLSSGCRLFFPRSSVKDEYIEYEMAEVTELQECKKSRYGILEPKEECLTEQTENLDIWLVPGIAFSQQGIRLGRGGGYYDRLLQFAKKKKVGILYEVQLYNGIPEEAHDIKMDVLITESGIYEL